MAAAQRGAADVVDVLAHPNGGGRALADKLPAPGRQADLVAVAFAVGQDLDLAHCAIQCHCHRVADQLDLADHLVSHHKTLHHAGTLRHPHRPAGRPRPHALRVQLLQLRGVQRQPPQLKGIGVGKHQPRRLLGTEVIHGKGCGRRQHRCRTRCCGCQQGQAHQKLQPMPRLTRSRSGASRKRCQSAFSTTPGETTKFAPRVVTRSARAAAGVSPVPRSA